MWSNRSINLLPTPNLGNPGYLTCWCTRKGGNLTTVTAILGWTWWHIGLDEDWNKLSQFHVKLFLVLLKCNTLIKLWRVWKTGKLVVFSVSPIPLAVTKQVEGVGYMAAHLQQKSPFYFQKTPTHTHTEWATSEGHSQGISVSSSFRRKTGGIRPTSSPEGSISLCKPGGRHSDFVFIFNFSIFTSPFWKNGKVKNKRKITMWPPGLRSVVYITV